MDKYLEANRRRWDELVPIHAGSAYYDVEGFKAGKSSLHSIERDELGDVRGKSLLHLQCHFGMDTLSWAREGAIVTGVDFSEPAIEQGRGLADEAGVDARFIVSDVYSLPDKLEEQFDIVFTSYGSLTWLPDLGRWAEVVARFLSAGGTFYAVEFHPALGIFEWGEEIEGLDVCYPYFAVEEPLRFDEDGTYADRGARLQNRENFSWPHPLSEVVTSLIESGLTIEFLHEFPVSTERHFGFMEATSDGMYRLTKHDGSVPLLYSIKATKRTTVPRK